MPLPDDLYDEEPGQPASRLPFVLSAVAGAAALASAVLLYQAEEDMAAARAKWKAGAFRAGAAKAALGAARQGLATEEQVEALARELAAARREHEAAQAALTAALEAGARTLAGLDSDTPRVPDLPPGQELVEK